jgi:predicted RecA/RadA family phage recombinase
MAANYVQEGDILTLTAPYTVTSGQGAQVGSQFGVALADITNAASGEFATCGVWDLTALSTATGAQGAKAYWDNSNKRVDTDGTVGILIGTLTTAKTNGQTTARVKLNEAVVGTSEGPQAAIADLTFGTNIAAATANSALVDSSAINPSDTEFNELAKELGTKINAILAVMRTRGDIAAS